MPEHLWLVKETDEVWEAALVPALELAAQVVVDFAVEVVGKAAGSEDFEEVEVGPPYTRCLNFC